MATSIGPRTKISEKLTVLCDHIELLILTPKAFTTAFLKKREKNLAFSHCFWDSNTGWDSTQKILYSIHTLWLLEQVWIPVISDVWFLLLINLTLALSPLQ
ncbi:hypothetical protein VP01_2040g1, partial [Puccinia sorghi]